MGGNVFHKGRSCQPQAASTPQGLTGDRVVSLRNLTATHMCPKPSVLGNPHCHTHGTELFTETVKSLQGDF